MPPVVLTPAPRVNPIKAANARSGSVNSRTALALCSEWCRWYVSGTAGRDGTGKADTTGNVFMKVEESSGFRLQPLAH